MNAIPLNTYCDPNLWDTSRGHLLHPFLPYLKFGMLQCFMLAEFEQFLFLMHSQDPQIRHGLVFLIKFQSTLVG